MIATGGSWTRQASFMTNRTVLVLTAVGLALTASALTGDLNAAEPVAPIRPVVMHAQATRPLGSTAKMASRTASEIWSQTLSGCPSVTDSDVNR